MRSLILALSLAGCAPSAVAPKAKTAPRVDPVVPVSAAPQPRPGGVAIEPYTPAAPRISITKPSASETLSSEAARSQSVVVDDGGYLGENPGARITLVLDGDVVRDIDDARTTLTLGGLDASGRAIGAGEHVLVAVVAGPRGEAARFGSERRTVATACRFFVGAPPAPAASASDPMLVVLVPRGTYNGPLRAKAALIDYVVLGGGGGADGLSLRVRVTGPTGVTDSVLSGPGPFALHGLDSGDHRLDFELQTAGAPLSGPWARTSRTITVNLDGPAR